MREISFNFKHPGLFVALAALAGGCAASGAGQASRTAVDVKQATPRTIDDATIKTAVLRRLAVDRSVPADALSVSTTTAVVTLSGGVPTLRARQRAVALAEAVKGVRAVVDRIRVTPARRPDGAIRQDILGALKRDPATEAFELSVEVKGGKVILDGQAEGWHEAELAQEVAESVRGVAAVENRISILHPLVRSDREIREEVRRLLENDVRVMADLITVQVQNGRVRLVGTVCSAAERTRARTLSAVQGVQRVDVSPLEVSWLTCDEMRRVAAPALSDDAIEKALDLAFAYDPRVKAFNIDADVTRGVVALGGTVDNLKAKQAAEQDARNTVGVARVENRLVVKPRWQLTDEELAKNVRAAIAWDPDLSRRDIKVVVSAGMVSLEGEVPSHFDRHLAVDVVSRVRGVGSIDDDLTIARGEPEDDWKILARIRDQLVWNPRLDDREIKVEVKDGVAILSGSVPSWYARQTAAKEAREAGAWRVKNELQVVVGSKPTARLMR